MPRASKVADPNHDASECLQCGIILSRRQDMARHIRGSHTNNPGFTCPVCSQVLKTKTTLRVHMNSLHDGEQIQCPDCTFTCGDPAKLFRHRCRHHGYVPTPRARRASKAKMAAEKAKFESSVNPNSVATLLSLATCMNAEDFLFLQGLINLIPYELVLLTLHNASYTMPIFWSYFIFLLGIDETGLNGNIRAGKAFSDLIIREQIVGIFRLCEGYIQLPFHSPAAQTPPVYKSESYTPVYEPESYTPVYEPESYTPLNESESYTPLNESKSYTPILSPPMSIAPFEMPSLKFDESASVPSPLEFETFSWKALSSDEVQELF